MNQSVQRRRPGAKLLAIIASLTMMLTGLVGVVLAPAASAHDSDLSVSSVCQPDGTWKITWTLDNDFGLNASVESSSNTAVLPNGTVIPKRQNNVNGKVSVEQIVNSTGTYSLSYTARWTDNFGQSGISKSIEIKGECGKKIELKVTLCHAGGQPGKYESTPVSINAVQNKAITDADIPNGHGTNNGQHVDDIIPPIIVDGFTYYPGKNWTTEGQAIYNNGCSVPSGDVPGGSDTYCVDYKNVLVSWAGSSYGGDTGRTKAQAEAIVAENKATALKDAGVQQGQEPGRCAPGEIKGGSDWYCVDYKNVKVEWDGAAYGGNTGVTKSEAEAIVAANKATALKNAGVQQGQEPGKCVPGEIPGGKDKYCVDEITVTVEWDGAAYGGNTGVTKSEAEKAVADNKAAALKDAGVKEGQEPGICEPGKVPGGELVYCINGYNVTVEWAGETFGGETGRTEAQAKAIVDENKTDALKDAGVKEGQLPGKCIPTEDWTLSCEAGLTLKLAQYPAGAPVLIEGLGEPIKAMVGEDGTFSFGPSGPLADGDYVVKVYVGSEPIGEINDKLRIDVEEDIVIEQPIEFELILELPVQCTPDVTNYSAGASKGASLEICTAEGTNESLSVVGTGSGSSTESQAAAQAAADNAAQTDADAKLAAAKANFPGATDGTCKPSTVVAPQAATVAPSNVAAPAPATVSVPAAATVPAAVPAGEGSQNPSIPLWALAMIVLGALGMATAGLKMAKDSK